jgi:cytochrome d ubiquinol oxidase subunit II
MHLQDYWFVAIALLWTGYFFLEGFDFGLGTLLPVLGRTEEERQALLDTIGPVWDGNEVWLIVAAGATFASFPLWYATLFSGFYLPLLVILVALILRGVAFEYRHRGEHRRWRAAWDRAIVFGSLVPAAGWGFVFGNVIRGVPINATFDYSGGLRDLLTVFSLVGALFTLSVFVLHGALFVTVKTRGTLEARASRIAARVGPVTALLAAVSLGWIQEERGRTATAVPAALAVAAVVGALILNRVGRRRGAFMLSGAMIVLVTATLFGALYPDVLPSTTDAATSLTVDNARSTTYTLTIMTWVAAVFLPLVLAYQGWTYWVFRHRVSVGDDRAAQGPGPASVR